MIQKMNYRERLPLNILLFLVALGFILLYLYVGIARVRYPYSLDFIEDDLVMQAWRVMRGEPDYVPPNADYVPQVYMPLYTWLGGLIFKVTGPGFGPLRALSFGATLATAGLIYQIAARESRSGPIAFGCAGLFLAGYRLVGGWYELARVENFYVLLTLAGVAVAIYKKESTWGLLYSGLLLGLSLLTKQHGLIYGAGVAVYLLLNVGRRLWLYLLSFTLAGIVPAWLANVASDGWLYRYAFGVAYASPVDPVRIVETLQREIFGAMALLTMSLLVILLSALYKEGPKSFIGGLLSHNAWPAFIGAAILVTIATRASVGGARQNYILGYAFLCLAPALVMTEIFKWRQPLQRSAYVVLWASMMLQFVLTWSPSVHNALGIINSTQFVPTAAMRESGDRFIARISAVDGPVFVMMHPPYALMAGKEPSVHIQSLWHARFRGRDPLPADLVGRIESHYYAMIISSQTVYFEMEPALVNLLNTYYTAVEVLPPSETPPTLSGPLSQPHLIYVPKASVSSQQIRIEPFPITTKFTLKRN